MVERLGEMRRGRRERIEKGSREGIEKETKRQFEEEGQRLFLSGLQVCNLQQARIN